VGIFKNYVKDQQGNVYLNQLLRYAKGTILVPADARQPIVTSTNSTSAPVIIEGPQDGVAELFALYGQHGGSDNSAVTNRLEVQITDIMWRRRMMNRHILADHIFGNNLQQFELLETILMQGQQALAFEFQNNSGVGSSNFNFGARAYKIQNADLSHRYAEMRYNQIRERKVHLYPYWMTTDNAVTVAASSTVKAFLSNTTDIEVAFFQLMGRGLSTGAAGDTTEMFTVKIIDPQTEDPLQSEPISLNNGFGTANFPYPLPAPILMPPNTQLELEITNLITDQSTEVYLTFAGVANYLGLSLDRVMNKGRVTKAPFLVQGAN